MSTRCASRSTFGAVLVAILSVACAPESQPQAAGITLPPGIRRALLGSLDSIRGTLEIMSGGQQVSSFGPVTADAGGVLLLPFSDIPVGTYEFVVRVTGSKGSFVDMPLAVYREPGIVISESQANNLVAASAAGSGQGEWELFTAGTADDDADDDGVSDLTELLFGLDPTSVFTELDRADEPGRFYAITGDDARAIFTLKGGFGSILASQAVRPVTAADLLAPPPQRAKQMLTWPNVGSACPSGVQSLQYIANTGYTGASVDPGNSLDPMYTQNRRALIGVGASGCGVAGLLPTTFDALETSGVGLGTFATSDAMGSGWSGGWAGIAMGSVKDSTGRYVMLLDTNGQSRLESWPINLWGDITTPAFTQPLASTNIVTASGAKFVATLDQCESLPVAAFGEKLAVGTGTAYLGAPGDQIVAVAHWLDASIERRCRLLVAVERGGGGRELVGASCALERLMGIYEEGSACALELDSVASTPGPYALPADAGVITAMVVGNSPIASTSDGPPGRGSLFVADDAGKVWVATEAVQGTANWTLVGTVPDGKPVMQMLAVRTDHADLDLQGLSPEQVEAKMAEFAAAGWLPTIIVATQNHVYRMP